TLSTRPLLMVCFCADTATPAIYTLSLHDALPIYPAVDALERRRVPRTLAVLLLALPAVGALVLAAVFGVPALGRQVDALITQARSEEHTSELQSRENLVCRLLLEKKNKQERARYR